MLKRLAWSFVVVGLFVLSTVAGAADGKAKFPGADDGGFLLPNGWRVTPAGDQITLTDLPLNIVVTPDGRHALVATNGYNAHELSLIDLATKKRIDKASVPQSWFGVAMQAKEQRLWWSGGGDSLLNSFDFADGKLKAGPQHKASKALDEKDAKAGNTEPEGFRTGLCLSADGSTLYSLTILAKGGGNRSFAWGDPSSDGGAGGAITAIDLTGKSPARSVGCGVRPYDVVLGRNGLLYVSDWARRRVLVVDPTTLVTVQRIPVGEHPNQIVLHPKDDRLFVACSSSNAVSVIDTSTGTVQETIFTALFPQSPEGSTPDALAVSPDGKRLFVANADNNCVAAIDVRIPRKSQVRGFIPTGWYPTALAVTPDNETLLVGVGKGNVTKSNKVEDDKLAAALKKLPDDTGYRRIPFPHVGTTLSGSLSILDLPEEDDEEEEEREAKEKEAGKAKRADGPSPPTPLPKGARGVKDDPSPPAPLPQGARGDKSDAAWTAWTDRVYRNCPYSDKQLGTAPSNRKTAIPTKVGDPSPITHVIYIIKENRTYDQVFSDIPRGNRDPDLLMFGEQISPNHHKLANEFVLLDNLYCNGHVSADGHPWSTMAYNTDYIARNWSLTYSKRIGIDDDDEGNLTNAPSGYIWDMCKRHGVTYRNYGEYGGRVSQPDGTFRMEGRVPGLIGHVAPKYGLPAKPGQKVRDTDRVEQFLEEFRSYEKTDSLPRCIVMSLGEDHTEGTKPGSPTPQACVASNDLALGRLVEAVSKSKYWKQIAIFVIEDDAQNGPDHVDAHRTIGLVISPYVRRRHLDSTQYSTVSMLRTMELILGLPPLSQFDAAANPMFESFTDNPDLTPYRHESAQIDLDAINPATAYGAERSSKMDFTEYDRIDDFELNEILWRSIKGVDAPLPPSVRRAIAFKPVTK